uniref:Uncharacterized protein n=1 Tax=Arundo donax TaxID=35708 RepID=A0A0A9DB63_ARUDO
MKTYLVSELMKWPKKDAKPTVLCSKKSVMVMLITRNYCIRKQNHHHHHALLMILDNKRLDNVKCLVYPSEF